MNAADRFVGWVRTDGEGGVYIGEGRVHAGYLPRFLRLVCDTAGTSKVLTLPRFDVNPGGERADAGWMVRPTPDGLQIRVYRVLPPDEARTLAAVIASFSEVEDLKTRLDERKVERLAAFLDEAYDVSPEELARSLLAGFDLPERAE